MQEKIIEFLKAKNGYISGDQISSRLNISRQALWKHIQELKECGYEIAAVPHLGYKLVSCADRLFPFEVKRGLATKFIGQKIFYLEAASSTMDIATNLGLEGVKEGAVIIAESQAKGRGRLGREWFSPKHKGLYFSLLLRPQLIPHQAPILTLLAAVSICEAIKETLQIDASIKWPNDIMVSARKLGGILTELNAETDKINFVIIGIGLNVNNERKALVAQATSLKEEKKEQIDRIVLLQSILRRIEKNYFLLQAKGAKPILENWRNNNLTLAKRVKISSQHKTIEGVAVDIDIDGALLIRKDSGFIERVTAGDVFHFR